MVRLLAAGVEVNITADIKNNDAVGRTHRRAKRAGAAIVGQRGDMIYRATTPAGCISPKTLRAGKGDKLGVADRQSKQADQQSEQDFSPPCRAKVFFYKFHNSGNESGQQSGMILSAPLYKHITPKPIRRPTNSGDGKIINHFIAPSAVR